MFVGNLEGRDYLGNLHVDRDNIKTNLEEGDFEGINDIPTSQNAIQWWPVVSTAMELRVSGDPGICFLTEVQPTYEQGLTPQILLICYASMVREQQTQYSVICVADT
jgi:hypothetical protein